MKSFGRNCLLLTALLVSASLCSSCDFLRAALGRPTSADLELMRSKAAEILEQQRQDSLAQVPASADTVAAADSIPAEVPSASLAENQSDTTAHLIRKDELAKPHYVIAGCFSTQEAALNFLRSMKAAGCSRAQSFQLRTDRFAITYCGCDTHEEAVAAMAEFKGMEICPPDIWIYNTNK